MLESQIVERTLPVLKWAGGKGKLLSQYQPYFPTEYGRYFEPFVGSGAVFFHLQPARARLSDVNPDLITVYQVLQTRIEELLSALSVHSERHDKDYYYQVRAERPEDPVKRAARMLYLNRTCYNGLYRVNSQGGFNVPMGRYKNPRILQPERLQAAARALQGVKVELAPFESVLKTAKRGDLVYFDPPYQPLSATSSFTAYAREGFGEPEQRHLADVYRKLAGKGVKLLLSNSDTPLIRELYADFYQVRVLAPRFINSKADRREPVGELLVVHPTPR